MQAIERRSRARRRAMSYLGAAILAATGLAVGAGPAASTHNYCHTEPFPEDVGIDVGPGVVWIGADTGTTGSVGTFVVCVDNLSFRVTVGTGGNVTVRADTCTGSTPSTCTVLVGTTGLVLAGPTVVSVPTTPVCVGVCVPVPTTPMKIDTGYDLYVNGGKVANVCISVGTIC